MNTTPKSKDLFDDTAMSFGEHLEILRIHLWKAIIGLVICMIGALFFGKYVIAFVRSPIDRALHAHNFPTQNDDNVGEFDFVSWLKQKVGLEEPPEEPAPEEVVKDELPPDTLLIRIKAADLHAALKTVAPESVKDRSPPDEEQTVTVRAQAEEFAQMHKLVEKADRPITINVQEAFMTYLKVALIAGFVIASPWIFYQIWLFVAAGLYPHEKRYVYMYLPMSLGLFIGGALFCFYAVFPFVLDFLLSFNKSLGVDPQIRLSEWISFAILLPMMFGLSFQLPLVMLFLERLQIFTSDTYRQKRRMAILVIAVISMLLTPADPMSMVLMMLPLVVLYEFGIILCGISPAARSPFDEAPA